MVAHSRECDFAQELLQSSFDEAGAWATHVGGHGVSFRDDVLLVGGDDVLMLGLSLLVSSDLKRLALSAVASRVILSVLNRARRLGLCPHVCADDDILSRE